jgi:hypothetical protein
MWDRLGSPNVNADIIFYSWTKISEYIGGIITTFCILPPHTGDTLLHSINLWPVLVGFNCGPVILRMHLSWELPFYIHKSS